MEIPLSSTLVSLNEVPSRHSDDLAHTSQAERIVKSWRRSHTEVRRR